MQLLIYFDRFISTINQNEHNVCDIWKVGFKGGGECCESFWIICFW